MQQIDSRRLPGPNLLWPRPGAVIDVALEEAERCQSEVFAQVEKALREKVLESYRNGQASGP